MDHAGRLVVPGDDDPVRVAISVSDTHLTMASGGTVIGTWPLEACKVETNGNAFTLLLEGDMAHFIPDQPASFTREILHRWPPARLADAMQAVRDATTGPASRPEQDEAAPAVHETLLVRWRRLEPGRRLQIISLLGGLLVVILLAIIFGGPRDQPPADSLAPLPAPPAELGFFEGTLADAAEAWNDAASRLRVDLFITRIPQGSQMEVQLNSRITLYGTADPRTGLVRALMVATGPGTGEEMQQVLGAWGALIAAASPDLEPGDRRSVLTTLGVDLNGPLIMNLDQETEVGAARYWLQSGLVGDRVYFGVEQRS